MIPKTIESDDVGGDEKDHISIKFILRYRRIAKGRIEEKHFISTLIHEQPTIFCEANSLSFLVRVGLKLKTNLFFVTRFEFHLCLDFFLVILNLVCFFRNNYLGGRVV